MTYQLDCPACRQKLCFPDSSDSYEYPQEGICIKCRYKYTLEQSKVVVFNSTVETMPSNTYGNKSTVRYKRTYQVRLLSANKTVKSLEFSTPGQQEQLAALPGDELLLLYTMRGTKQKDLAWIKNQTTTQGYLLQNPRALARSMGTKAGFMVFAASTIIATILHIPLFDNVFLATVTPSAIGVAVYVTKRKNYKVSDRSELARLSSEQQLLVQKFEFEQKSEVLRQEIEDESRVIDRLKNLQEKMLNTDEQLYTERIAIVSNGIKVLENNLLLAQSLITGYEHICNMLTIDYETSSLAKQLPDDITAKILSQLEELKTIEAQKETMSLLINPQRLLDLE
jgi:hypothetical protein